MAFVAPSFSSNFIGTKSNVSICPPSTNTAPRWIAPKTISQATPSMAFSSIDDPSTSIAAFDSSVETGDVVITSLYKHIFGNAYVMESERAELAIFESQYRENKINVRYLARMMAKSTTYRKRFFERCGPYRFIELNFKHFLGRAPSSQEEISEHVQLLHNSGYEAEIDSYFDSNEYIENFGFDMVPRFIFKGCYPRNDDFNRMCLLREYWDGCSTSTVSGSTAPAKPIKARLIMPVGAHCSNPVSIKRGILVDHAQKDLSTTSGSGINIPTNSNAPVRIKVWVADNNYKVFETEPMKAKFESAWKTDMEKAATKKNWNGVWY